MTGDLKVAGLPPIDDFAEEVAQLAEGEEEAVAEVGGQRGQIRNRNHSCSKFCDRIELEGRADLKQNLDPRPVMRERGGREGERDRERERGLSLTHRPPLNSVFY